MSLQQSLQSVEESSPISIDTRKPPCPPTVPSEPKSSTPRRGVKRKEVPSTKKGSGPKRKRVRTLPKKGKRKSSLKSSKKKRSQSPPPEHKGRKIRIGIILTEPKSEQKKEELIPIGEKKRPWTRFANKKQMIRRRLRNSIPIKNPAKKKESVPADISIGLYIEYAYGGYGFEVDYIFPKDLTEERCRQNDINFCMIYDLLEAYHINKDTYKEFEQILTNCDNIYPPYDYQKFINSKINYYGFCQENGIEIAPTFTLTPEQFKERYPGGGAEAAPKLFDEIHSRGWWEFIAKPVFGQESLSLFKGYTSYQDDGWMAIHQRKDEERKLAKYLDNVFAKYPGLVFQKLIPDFGNGSKCPELRMYYVGGKYQYSMCSAGGRYLRPKEEGGKTEFPLDVLKPHTVDILAKLPKMVMQGKELPRLLDRFDMGYIVNGKPVTPYVNEIEFVPSLYIEDHPFVVDKELGDQMVNIALALKGTSLDEMASFLEI